MKIPDLDRFFKQPLLVLDVESIGLHGQGFAYALAVYMQGKEVHTEINACPRALAHGTPADRAWVEANVPTLAPTVDSPRALRQVFWNIWMHWKPQAALLVADCPWPVEARFLLACVEDQGPQAAFDGPYPLLDVMTLASLPGMTIPPRQAPQECPAHHPLADARHTASRLFSFLNQLSVQTQE